VGSSQREYYGERTPKLPGNDTDGLLRSGRVSHPRVHSQAACLDRLVSSHCLAEHVGQSRHWTRVYSSSERQTKLERKGSMETASVPVMDLCSEPASEERPPKRVRRMLAPPVGSSPCWAAPQPTLRGHGACRASVQALLSLLQLLRCAAWSSAQPWRSPLASLREHARQSAQRHTPVPSCARCIASRGLFCWSGSIYIRVL